MFFFTFYSSFRLGKGDGGHKEARILVTQGVTTFKDFFHSSERSSPLSSSCGGSTSHYPSARPFISLSTSKSVSGDLYKTEPTDLYKHVRVVCDLVLFGVEIVSF